MPEAFNIRVTKDFLVFSAAHFITIGDKICERLHGHNYKVMVEIFGPLDENSYVVDFIAVRDRLHELVLELDHHVLLPTGHEQISVVAEDREVTARYEDRRWVFPREDVVLLDMHQTTAELLAKYLATRLREVLAEKHDIHPPGIRMHVDECEGQWGVYEWRA